MPGERILVADDVPDIVDLCQRILRAQGYHVIGVRDGQSAIACARKEPFDLFLADVLMPGMSGLEAAQAVREIQPECVVVMMTGFGTMDTALQALRLGSSDLVIKPFTPQDLQLAINRALERERLRRENQRLRALLPLFELSKTMMATVNREELARQVLQTACRELAADRGVLLLPERSRPRLRVASSTWAAGGELPPAVLERLLSTATRLLQEREQIVVQAAGEAPPSIAAMLRDLDSASMIFSPLLTPDEPVGALVVARADPGAGFGPGDAELLSVLCGQAAAALRNAALFEEIQRAYRELQSLDHMKSEFINIAGHELRTPLALLMGHADLLLEDVRDRSLASRLQIILDNAMRLRDLLDDLLDMRHLQAGASEACQTPFSLADLIVDTLFEASAAAQERSLDVQLVMPEELGTVHSDPDKVACALANLVDNAIRFTPPGGQIGVEVTRHEGEWWVAVWDTGIGIEEEEQERIFRPFHQTEESLTRVHTGMGLGLPIAKGMIELCGGQIWVESTPSQGSRFTFSIPDGRPSLETAS